VEETYVGDGDVRRGPHKSVRDFDENDSILQLVFTPRIKLGVLRLGAEWERFSFGVPDSAPLPDTLQSVNLVIGLDTQLSDSILIRVEAQPGVYNSGLDDLSNDFNLPFVIGGTYIYSPDLQIVLGVGVDVERKYPVIPVAGVRWKMARQWVLDAVLPTPRLDFEINRDVTLYAGANVKQTNFRVDDNFGDAHGIPKLNHAILSYSEVRTGAGFDWKVSPIMTFTGEVGYQPYRNFDFYRADVRYHQESGAPYGMLSLHGAF
jgi:opacity protein-like surface antigen